MMTWLYLALCFQLSLTVMAFKAVKPLNISLPWSTFIPGVGMVTSTRILIMDRMDALPSPQPTLSIEGKSKAKSQATVFDFISDEELLTVSHLLVSQYGFGGYSNLAYYIRNHDTNKVAFHKWFEEGKRTSSYYRKTMNLDNVQRHVSSTLFNLMIDLYQDKYKDINSINTLVSGVFTSLYEIINQVGKDNLNNLQVYTPIVELVDKTASAIDSLYEAHLRDQEKKRQEKLSNDLEIVNATVGTLLQTLDNITVKSNEILPEIKLDEKK